MTGAGTQEGGDDANGLGAAEFARNQAEPDLSELWTGVL